MKIISIVLSLFISTSLSTAIQERDAGIQELLTTLSPCGLSCIVPVVLKTNCSITNTTELAHCFCTNNAAEYNISSCLLDKCTYKERFTAHNAQKNLCLHEPQESRQTSVFVAAIISSVFVIIFVALRCWSRYFITGVFWWDDWLLLCSAAIFLTLQGTTLWGVRLGFPKHIWNVDPLLAKSLYRFLWIYEILYIFVQGTSKLSVLMLYYRIFPQPWLRRVCIGYSVFILCHLIGFLFPVVFSCNPIALVYDKSITGGKCLDNHAIALAGAIFSIVEDLTIITLPIPSILKLRLSIRKKVSVVFAMGVGIIACIASLVRIKYILGWYTSLDQNWTDYGICLSSIIELSLSIICVCFPAFKILLNTMFPKYFGWSDSNASSGPRISLSRIETTQTPKSFLHDFKRRIGLGRTQIKQTSESSGTSAGSQWSDIERRADKSLPRFQELSTFHIERGEIIETKPSRN